MALPPELVAILVGPRTKTPLVYFPRGERDDDDRHAFLLAPSPGLRYRIDDDIPVMLAEEAVELPRAEVDRLLAAARGLGIATP